MKKTAPKRRIRKKTPPKKTGKKTGFKAKQSLVRIAPRIRSRILNIKKAENAPPQAAAGTGPEFEIKKTKIRIIGIGGGGGNIVSEIAQKVSKSSFWIANTDFQALKSASKNVSTFQFGEKLTHGLGTGMDARVAEEAAAEERDKIRKIMEGQDMIILVSSLGGGTGSGAAPVFAQVSKSLGNLTYGIFTLPFDFEGAKKGEIAKNALERIRPYVNALTILPNERVFGVVPKNTPFSKTLSHINNVLSDSLEGLIETIYDTGVINIDFADLRAILAGNGKIAFLNAVSFKKGQEANLESFEKAFSSPLYPYTIDKVRGLLLNIVANKDLKLLEVNKILASVANRIHKDAKIIFGVAQEGAASDTVKVTLLATGCSYNGQDADIEKEAVAAAEGNEAAPEKQAQDIRPAKKPKPAVKNPLARQKKGKSGKAGAKARKIKVKKITAAKKAETAKKTETAPETAKTSYQDQSGIEAQFEPPVRKNAVQVKKEIEREEKEMLDKEKAWEIPAFLRKQKK